MLITFKSDAAPDLLMYQEHAKPILDLLHKEAARGVITPQELPGAIAALEVKINEAKQAATPAAPEESWDEQGSNPALRKPVPFAARAFPMLEMLRASQKRNCGVMWGV